MFIQITGSIHTRGNVTRALDLGETIAALIVPAIPRIQIFSRIRSKRRRVDSFDHDSLVLRQGPHLAVHRRDQGAPTATRDDARLAYFLKRVPVQMRVALEFRNPTWNDEAVFALLEKHGAAYCVMSGAHLPCVLRTTADFVYVRLHGPDHDRLYAGSYTDADLWWWADRVREWQTMGRDVFVYFNNDGDGNAVRNATTLTQFVAAPGHS